MSTAEGGAGASTTIAFSVSSAVGGASSTVVSYTVSGTASAGSDYSALSGTVTFGVGETTQTIELAVSGDATCETDETVIVTLTTTSDALATISGTAAVGTATITNDE